eukprot:5858655-Pyramimonas_sp.AAC.1
MARPRSLEPPLQHDPEPRNAEDETRRRPCPWLTLKRRHAFFTRRWILLLDPERLEAKPQPLRLKVTEASTPSTIWAG